VWAIRCVAFRHWVEGENVAMGKLLRWTASEVDGAGCISALSVALFDLIFLDMPINAYKAGTKAVRLHVC